MLLEVRRNHVMKDALVTIQYSQDDLSSKLQINFIGEAGVDLGGLRPLLIFRTLGQRSRSQ
ncbi:hypothetical protein DPMN_097799 [Dreissena polymorpha]|uniref:HECT domain-containing protein n=1 Tax=Dreissena polymorpha TaxID=45954 RepID=A0A9D4LBV7_DREPO|nr:hypothetical protein DPMN_097799 [Dreissena polymorpha]